VTVAAGSAAGFEATMKGLPCTRLGAVVDEPEFRINNGKRVIVDVALAQLEAAWKKPLAW
jgi:hypothetical protein